MATKSTGWKVPLIFCMVVLVITAIVSFFMPDKAQLPPLPEDLLAKARQIKIDLDNPEGKYWHTAILDAASGFSPVEAKDVKLYNLFRGALHQNRLDAACATLVHIKGEQAREQALYDLWTAALKDCANLPWGLFALSAQSKEAEMQKMGFEMTSRWEACKRKAADDPH